jgi:Tat protein translocase TatB subunit
MFNVGGGEIIVILLLALIVLGPDKLPSAARQAGKYLSEFRRISDGFQRELRDAMDIDLKPQSGTMAPVPRAEVATPADPEKSDDGTPVGESHRVIDSSNGPTLPPVMQPTTSPGTPTSVTEPVDVDGPSSSFS